MTLGLWDLYWSDGGRKEGNLQEGRGSKQTAAVFYRHSGVLSLAAVSPCAGVYILRPSALNHRPVAYNRDLSDLCV